MHVHQQIGIAPQQTNMSEPFFRLIRSVIRWQRFKAELEQFQRRQGFKPADTPCFRFALAPRPYEYRHQPLKIMIRLLPISIVAMHKRGFRRLPLNLLQVFHDGLQSSNGFVRSIQSFIIVDKTSGSLCIESGQICFCLQRFRFMVRIKAGLNPPAQELRIDRFLCWTI